MVLTTSFGRPRGRFLITSRARAVPIDPPPATTPSISPLSYSFFASLTAPCAILSMTAVGSCSRDARSSSRLAPPARATSAELMAGTNGASPRTPTSIAMTRWPRSSMSFLRYANWSPFVSRVPIITIVLAMTTSIRLSRARPSRKLTWASIPCRILSGTKPNSSFILSMETGRYSASSPFGGPSRSRGSR